MILADFFATRIWAVEMKRIRIRKTEDDLRQEAKGDVAEGADEGSGQQEGPGPKHLDVPPYRYTVRCK